MGEEKISLVRVIRFHSHPTYSAREEAIANLDLKIEELKRQDPDKEQIFIVLGEIDLNMKRYPDFRDEKLIDNKAKFISQNLKEKFLTVYNNRLKIKVIGSMIHEFSEMFEFTTICSFLDITPGVFDLFEHHKTEFNKLIGAEPIKQHCLEIGKSFEDLELLDIEK